MSSLHPHWHSTEDEQPVAVRVAKTSTSSGKTVSRAPAAIVGILVIVAVVVFAFGGVKTILGQLTDPTPDVTVHLKATAADPATVTIRPGQVIRFVNDDQIPHVLTSDTLPTNDGKPFDTLGIFPGEDYFYTAPATATAATHTYVSQTNEDVTGQIVIETGAAPLPASGGVMSMSSASSISSVSIFAPLSSSSAPIQAGTTSSIASTTPFPAGILAVNPHVVGSKTTGTTTSRKPGVTQHKPTANTESGPELWIVFACAVTALCAATGWAFRRV